MAAAVALSPVQQTWDRYVRHTLHCTDCRDVDRTCDMGTELWRIWREIGDAASRQVRDETA